jgi:ferritin
MSTPATRFGELLNAQIGHEFAASQQYVAIAVYYDGEALPQLAGHFYRQAVEERNHAMMIVQFMLDTDRQVAIPGTPAPQVHFGDTTQPVSIALAQERQVTEQVAALAAAARAENDFQGEQFMGWFLKEQTEEVASMSTLLRVCERAGTNVLLVEDFLARETVGEGDDATAPAAAGGAL